MLYFWSLSTKMEFLRHKEFRAPEQVQNSLRSAERGVLNGSWASEDAVGSRSRKGGSLGREDGLTLIFFIFGEIINKLKHIFLL